MDFTRKYSNSFVQWNEKKNRQKIFCEDMLALENVHETTQNSFYTVCNIKILAIVVGCSLMYFGIDHEIVG